MNEAMKISMWSLNYNFYHLHNISHRRPILRSKCSRVVGSRKLVIRCGGTCWCIVGKVKVQSSNVGSYI